MFDERSERQLPGDIPKVLLAVTEKSIIGCRQISDGSNTRETLIGFSAKRKDVCKSKAEYLLWLRFALTT